MTILPTSGAPSNNLGVAGDFAFDPVAKIFYGPKGPGSWPSETLDIPGLIASAVTGGVTGLLSFKGAIDANANPNYPAASKGHSYVISVAGKIGGSSGKAVDAGDFVIAIADNAGGTEASVGTSWIVIEHNLPTLGNAATKDVGTGSGDVAAGNAPATAEAAAIAAAAAAAPSTIFPDSDPAIAGAGYWVAGVLTKSAGP